MWGGGSINEWGMWVLRWAVLIDEKAANGSNYPVKQMNHLSLMRIRTATQWRILDGRLWISWTNGVDDSG